MKDDTSDHITYFWSSNAQVLWSTHYLFCLLVFFLVMRGLTIAAVPWMMDLWSSHWTAFVGMVCKMNNKFCCYPRCSSSMIIRHNPLQCTAIPFTYGFCPLFLSADAIFPWFVYAIITLETAALDSPNKVTVLVTDSWAKHPPTLSSLKIWKVSHIAVHSYELLQNTICHASSLALHSVTSWSLSVGNDFMCYSIQISSHKEKCNNVPIIPYLYGAQHVSSITPPIIRSPKLHWQPLAFHTWKVVGRVVAGRCQAPGAWHRPATHVQQPSTYE
jgi:hypothetical protein